MTNITKTEPQTVGTSVVTTTTTEDKRVKLLELLEEARTNLELFYVLRTFIDGNENIRFF